jgi:hypothetical protein
MTVEEERYVLYGSALIISCTFLKSLTAIVISIALTAAWYITFDYFRSPGYLRHKKDMRSSFLKGFKEGLDRQMEPPTAK